MVQKLIATVNSRTQIAMLRSAIQPDFLDLVKDLNGNHVIQRCLQYFSCKDNGVYHFSLLLLVLLFKWTTNGCPLVFN